MSDKISKKPDGWLPMPRFLLRINALNSILGDIELQGKECLEIGFGAGEVLKIFASKGAGVTGVDFSEDAREIAKNRTRNCTNAHKITIITSLEAIKSDTFDLVIALEVLEHIEDDHLAFSQWLDYLKPSGHFIISVPAHMDKWGDNDVWAGHYRRYEKSDLLDLCNENNISVLKIWNYGYPLTLILDKILHSSKKHEATVIKSSGISNDKLSKKSGIERDNKLIYRLLSNNIMLFPFYQMQKLFYTVDRGAGYILHGQKR